MGRKIEMKKIDHVTKCQVTFSKRRSSLINMAKDISIFCDIDVALVAFAPSGRVSQYCNKTSIEDVLNRYADLPADKRLIQMENIEDKVEMLKQLSHIKGETSKLHFLDKHVENLQLQIEKCSLESQILEANLRDYEIPEKEPASLHQSSWCERNLRESLAEVMARKSALAHGMMLVLPHRPIQLERENLGGMLYSSNLTENQLAAMEPNPPTGEHLMKFDPWTNIYRYGSSSGVAANANISGIPQSRYNEIMGLGGYLQFPDSNCNHSNNSAADEIIGQSGINLANNLSNANAGNASLHIDGFFGMNSSQVQRNGQLHALPYQFQPAVTNTYTDTSFGSMPFQDALGVNMPFQSGAQSNSWNWEDLLDVNDNHVDYPPRQ